MPSGYITRRATKGETMAESVIFIGWDRIVVGREKQAMQLWQKVMQYYSNLQTDGRIEGFDAVILSAHGGDLNGFVILKGDAIKLEEIRREDTFVQYDMEAIYCLQGYGVVPGYTGAGVAKILSQWLKLISS
jgi:hypothetical protein